MRLPFASLALALAGCRNSCQELCVEMADFAEECGFEVSKEELKTCIQEHANKAVSPEQREACADAAPNLREEWTCDEIGDYFSAGGAGGGGGGGGDGDDTGE